MKTVKEYLVRVIQRKQDKKKKRGKPKTVRFFEVSIQAATKNAARKIARLEYLLPEYTIGFAAERRAS